MMTFSDYHEHRNQWDSGAFTAWFGNSVVRDGSGNPLRVYTGTSKDTDFKSFRPGKAGLIWFTADPKSASDYALENESQGYKLGWDDKTGRNAYIRTNTRARVIPVYLKIENPFVDRSPPTHPDFKQQSAYILSKMRGHDGYVSPENGLYVITNPLQAKSAIGNRGTFNPAKKDLHL